MAAKTAIRMEYRYDSRVLSCFDRLFIVIVIDHQQHLFGQKTDVSVVRIICRYQVQVRVHQFAALYRGKPVTGRFW